MQRRDVVRLLATGAALQLAPRKLMAVMREARALVAEQKSSPRTLNPHQYATVTAMAELIIPRTDTPGARDVGTSDFIDLMLTEWYEEPQRKHFLDGLAGVDSRTKGLFGRSFVDVSAEQQSEILMELGAKMVEANERPRSSPWGYDPTNEMNFYAMFRRLTLTAYFTSEDGATKDLHFEIIPDHYQGCEKEATQEGTTRE
jgi:hypothetical protein